MGDEGSRLTKDKRRRSSSSLHTADGRRSERKLKIRASIPEFDDQFAIAEARCDQLQQELDYVRTLKRRKKIKRRSLTKLSESGPVRDNLPHISIRTKPKKFYAGTNKAARGKDLDLQYQHFEMSPKETTGKELEKTTKDKKPKLADAGNQVTGRQYVKSIEENIGDGNISYKQNSVLSVTAVNKHRQAREAPIVELFSGNKRSKTPSPRLKTTTVWETDSPSHDLGEQLRNHSSDSKQSNQLPEKASNRFNLGGSHRYERPTVSSQLKQAGVKYYMPYGTQGSIPFVAGKSCTPSHNIGVNLQQVLNGIKIQQPIGGIPLTIAHHMGLRQLPQPDSMEPQKPSVAPQGMNAWTLQGRLTRLPRHASYRRLLQRCREGEGVVPKFLNAVNRPHAFYTPVYSLDTYEDGSVSRAAYTADTRQALAEYTAIYRTYTEVERAAARGDADADLLRRRDELAAQLQEREGYIRQVVQHSEQGERPSTSRSDKKN